MILLNLKANDSQQKRIKDYLQENVSEVLAEKINNGVFITKDNKTLISKKDLDGFIEYACKTAQEQAEKGKRSAMVEDDVVFGWAIHYFTEDGIEGKLFNPDGTPYEPPKPKYTPKPIPADTPKPKNDIQPNMLDLLSEKEDDVSDEDLEDAQRELAKEDNPSVDEICDRTDKELDKTNNVSPIYKAYTEIQSKYKDCIVAYRLGDFYEIFGDNAIKIADALDLTLTRRDVGLPDRIPMVGFPYHVADTYIGKLVQKGYKVAIAESLNNITIRNKTMKIDGETGELLKHPYDDLINVLLDLLGNNMEIRL